jgi:hypothetical protein
MAKSLPHNLIEIRREWAGLSAYERFEAFVALMLTLLIAAVIAVALWRLIAVLALVRKIIVTDLSAMAPDALAAEAALILALGITYWVMRSLAPRSASRPRSRSTRLSELSAVPLDATRGSP